MVELTIKVTGAPKWVMVEDVSGPSYPWNGYIQEGTPQRVEIFSTADIPGNVVVYAGPRQNQWTARFHEENFTEPCTLTLSDKVAACTIAKETDAETGSCGWKNLLEDAALEARTSAEAEGRADAARKSRVK